MVEEDEEEIEGEIKEKAFNPVASYIKFLYDMGINNISVGSMQVLTALRANKGIDYERYKLLCAELGDLLGGEDFDDVLSSLLSYILVMIVKRNEENIKALLKRSDFGNINGPFDTSGHIGYV